MTAPQCKSKNHHTRCTKRHTCEKMPAERASSTHGQPSPDKVKGQSEPKNLQGCPTKTLPTHVKQVRAMRHAHKHGRAALRHHTKTARLPMPLHANGLRSLIPEHGSAIATDVATPSRLGMNHRTKSITKQVIATCMSMPAATDNTPAAAKLPDTWQPTAACAAQKPLLLQGGKTHQHIPVHCMQRHHQAGPARGDISLAQRAAP